MMKKFSINIVFYNLIHSPTLRAILGTPLEFASIREIPYASAFEKEDENDFLVNN